MLEYGKEYFQGNKRWIAQAKKRMSPAAFRVAQEMAKESNEELDNEEIIEYESGVDRPDDRVPF